MLRVELLYNIKAIEYIVRHHEKLTIFFPQNIFSSNNNAG